MATKIRKEFKDFLIKNDYLKNDVENHLWLYRDNRYDWYKKKDLEFDLITNHDFSLEYDRIEDAEDWMWIELTDEEKEYYNEEFIKEAKKQW